MDTCECVVEEFVVLEDTVWYLGTFATSASTVTSFVFLVSSCFVRSMYVLVTSTVDFFTLRLDFNTIKVALYFNHFFPRDDLSILSLKLLFIFTNVSKNVSDAEVTRDLARFSPYYVMMGGNYYRGCHVICFQVLGSYCYTVHTRRDECFQKHF